MAINFFTVTLAPSLPISPPSSPPPYTRYFANVRSPLSLHSSSSPVFHLAFHLAAAIRISKLCVRPERDARGRGRETGRFFVFMRAR